MSNQDTYIPLVYSASIWVNYLKRSSQFFWKNGGSDMSKRKWISRAIKYGPIAYAFYKKYKNKKQENARGNKYSNTR